MISPIRRFLPFGVVALVIGVAAGGAFLASARDVLHSESEICATPASNNAEESQFFAENGAAMTRMMRDMAVKPAGDIDRDFVAMMVPHHHGAIEMARAVLRYGRNPQIRRMAQEIIVTQQQEISAMRLAVGEPLSPVIASPVQPSPRPAPEN